MNAKYFLYYGGLPPYDGYQWPKHVRQTDSTYLIIKLVTLNGFLLLYILREYNTQDVLCKLMYLDLVILLMFAEECKLSSSSCNLLQLPVTSSLLGSDIPLITLFSNPINLYSCLRIREQVRDSHTTIRKLWFCIFYSRVIKIGMIHVSVISLFVNNEVEIKFNKCKIVNCCQYREGNFDIRVPPITQHVKQKHVVTSIKSLLSDLTFERVYLVLVNLVL
jgi:hypothetical protein